MLEPALGLKTAISRETSLLKRIRKTLSSVWESPRVSLASSLASGTAPIHHFEIERAKAGIGAQAGSTFVHTVFFATLIFGATQPLVKDPVPESALTTITPSLEYWAPRPIEGAGSVGGKAGGGGDRSLLLPTAGELAPLSRIVLAPPRLPDVRMHPLPMPVAMYDAEAPEMAAPEKDLGLPWMKDKNDSAGPGAAGVGNNPGRGMGRNGFDGEGEAESALRFGSIASEVSCKYCPDPAYSEEARQQKLQGTVAMRVLVGADGRVKDVQLKRRLGLGLDENAVQAVRSWQFIPAKDAARRPLASWITVETLFRLY